MIAPPSASPNRNGGCRMESLSTFADRLCVSSMMMEKMSVVAPTTAVPMSTGFEVALKVLPAPSFASRNSLPRSNAGRKPNSRRISSEMPGAVSMTDSSYTDCALSVTGP
jgi:hypothetical protein